MYAVKIWAGDDNEAATRFKLGNDGPFGDRPSVKEWLRLGMPNRRSEVFSHDGKFLAHMDTTGMVRAIFVHEPQSEYRPIWRRDFDSVSGYIESLKVDNDWKKYLGRGHSVYTEWEAFLSLLIANTPTEG